MNDEEASANLRAEFQKLAELASPRPVVLVVFPRLDSFDNYGFRNEHIRAARAVEGLGIEVVDLLDTFREYRAVDLMINANDHTHPNAEGTGFAVDVTLDRLIEKSILPSQ